MADDWSEDVEEKRTSRMSHEGQVMEFGSSSRANVRQKVSVYENPE